MASRKSAAAAEEDQGPTLTLVMEKGPLSGQRNDFRPGSLVKIGRVVRGNTLAIKDSGVSTKHLLIQFDAATDPDRRRWTITDLGSSNGTFLNGVELDPSEPAALSDGDVVKIGEQTSIMVKLEVSGAETEVGSGNARRNARRRARGQVGDLVVIKEEAELGLQNEDEEVIDKVAQIEANQGRKVSTRRTRNSVKNDKLATNLNVEGDKDLMPSGIEGSRGVSTRRTRNSRKTENVNEIEVDSSVIEGKRTRKGGKGRKKQEVETICEETEKEDPNLDQKAHEEETERSEVGVDESCIEVKHSGIEGIAAEFTSTSRYNTEADKRKMVPDLEKMSLGEWLDFLDVHEPQDIIDQTEEMLAEMRRKAERCHEFMLQHKNGKDKGEVAV